SPLAPCPVIAASDLQRSVDSLRPGIGEEHVVQAFRRLFHQAAGEFKGARVAHSEGGNIVKAPSSVSDRLDDAGLGMACVDAPKAGHCVEDAAAIRCDVMHSFSAAKHSWMGKKLAHGRKGHPVCLIQAVRAVGTLRKAAHLISPGQCHEY